MYSELHQYFIRHRNLNLPGIGNLILERKSAEADFVNKCIHPPVYSVSLVAEQEKPSIKFYSWLASVFNISEKDAVIRFNDFVFDLKKDIRNGAKVEWEGIGVLRKGLGEGINFKGQQIISNEKTVSAEKIIRERAEHSVLVGTTERTSAEMTEYYNQPGAKRNLWWVLPVTLLLIAFVFIGWYFSKNGVGSSSLGNTQKTNSSSLNDSYREIK